MAARPNPVGSLPPSPPPRGLVSPLAPLTVAGSNPVPSSTSPPAPSGPAGGRGGPARCARWRAWPRSAAPPVRCGRRPSRCARPSGCGWPRPARRTAGTSGPGSPGWRPARGRRVSAGAARRSRTGFVQRGGGQFLGPRDLLGGYLGVIRDGVGRGRQVKEQAYDALADPVVDLPGEPGALALLPLDRPLSELLERLLAFGQAQVQAGVLDRARAQARHRAQEFGVGGGELPAQPGAHVEHPTR